MTRINIIVAADSKGGIGRNNQLPWHLPADLKHFKTLTTGHAVIMGRKTFDSLGKALPLRRNIVISRQADLQYRDAEVASSLESALALCKHDAEVFVIGGAEIFRQAIPLADTIHLTVIHHPFEADTFLPEIPAQEWTELKREDHEPDEKNKFRYSFITLKNKVTAS